MKKISYVEAIQEATEQEMRKNKGVIIFYVFIICFIIADWHNRHRP